MSREENKGLIFSWMDKVLISTNTYLIATVNELATATREKTKNFVSLRGMCGVIAWRQS
jgi:hypothetical protein